MIIRSFYAHKAVLAVQSPVFLAILQQNMKESKEASENVAEVSDSDSFDRDEVVSRFLYYNEVVDLPKV